MEIFKDIPKWEGLYQVSNIGSVKSLPRKWSPRETILRQSTSHDGYLKVSLKSRPRVEHIEVNRLVALAFIDASYIKRGLVCDHIDRDKKNNRLENLRVVSMRENASNHKDNNEMVGAHWHSKNKKWTSSIQINGKGKHLGTFNTQSEAAATYSKALAWIGTA